MIGNDQKCLIYHFFVSDIKEKDINEMVSSGKTERDIKDIIARNTFNGLLARTKLSAWKRI